MPANLSPEYKAAEAAFRQARTTRERLACLREMLRVIPKHKGTDHLQADLKTRIKELTQELAEHHKGGARSGPSIVVHPEGAAQIVLLGPPNSGKSALHARLTGSGAQIAPFPFTTQLPLPGMLPYEDIHFQLVDLPPLSRQHLFSWMGNALQPADAALLVVDLADPGCIEAVSDVHRLLSDLRVKLTRHWPGGDPPPTPPASDEDFFGVCLPTLLILSKADLIDDLDGELAVFRELTGIEYPVLAVSAESGDGLQGIGGWLFDSLAVARVYTKAPGRPADRDKPFTVRRGQTVNDVACLVHRDLAESLRFARLWGAGHFDGQQVGGEHPVSDGDILELHS